MGLLDMRRFFWGDFGVIFNIAWGAMVFLLLIGFHSPPHFLDYLRFHRDTATVLRT